MKTGPKPPHGKGVIEMSYPTIEQVNEANYETICRWYRFLPSPGSEYIPRSNKSPRSDYEKFDEMLAIEAKIMDRIAERLKEFGGFTPEISKRIGWGT